jgi:acetyl-CoA synthetase (ADP-forming)
MAGTTQSVAQDVPLFLKAGIPIYSDPARAARALGRLWEYTQFRRRSEDGTERSATHRKGVNAEQEEGADVVTRALKEGRTALSEHESKELLHAHGIPVTREQEACDEPGFRQALSDIRFPLVVKGCGPGLSHKTERGLVYVNVSTEEEAMTVFREIRSKMKNEVGSVMVQEMVKGTRELIMGFLRDGQFGPCVMFGLGGIFAEALGDISFRPVPLEKQDAVDMLHEIKAFKILGPYRNMPAADIDELACMLMHLGTIGLEEPRIKEIDVNPVILSGSRPVAVDALIVLNP